MHNLYKKYGSNIIINAFPIRVTTYETPDTRKTDVQLDYPEYYIDNIIYDMGDLKIKSLPNDIAFASKYGIYSITYEQQENKVIQKKIILIDKGNYPIEEYPDFYKFVSAIKNNELKNTYIEIL